MLAKPLDGKKVAVFIEHKFIPEEIRSYIALFSHYGAHLDFVSRLWYGPSYHPADATFYADVDPLDDDPWMTPTKQKATVEVSQIKPEDYAAVLMSANYTVFRMLYFDDLPENARDIPKAVQSAPVPNFFARAMANKKVVKGALCHGLMILTPFPDLLKGRKVICNPVVMAPIILCNPEIVVNQAKVVVDEDLVTGLSKHEVVPYVEAIVSQVIALAP